MYARAWWGIVAPAGTPGDNIIEKLNIGLNRVIRDPQFQEKRMLPQGPQPGWHQPGCVRRAHPRRRKAMGPK